MLTLIYSENNQLSMNYRFENNDIKTPCFTIK